MTEKGNVSSVEANDKITGEEQLIDPSPKTEEVEQVTQGEEENSVDTPEEIVQLPTVEELSKELAEAEKKAQELWDNLLRQRAESENLRKRVERDLDNARKYALERFAKELLAVKDSMELGLEAANKPETDMQAVRDGLALTLKMLTDTLNKFDINVIDPLNAKFDPQWHEAMAIQPVPEVEEGTVILVHQKGYQLADRLLRPARVIVAKALENPVPEEKPLEN